MVALCGTQMVLRFFLASSYAVLASYACAAWRMVSSTAAAALKCAAFALRSPHSSARAPAGASSIINRYALRMNPPSGPYPTLALLLAASSVQAAPRFKPTVEAKAVLEKGPALLLPADDLLLPLPSGKPFRFL